MTPEQFSGKPLTEMTLAEVQAFQNYRNREAPNTNAVGKYQFMRTTLFGSAGKPGLVDQLKLPMDTIFNADTQELLQATMRKGNAAALEKQGVPATDANLNLANAVGAGGVVKLLKPENADKNAIQVLGLTGAAATTNPQLNKLSKDVIAETYSKYDASGMAPGGRTPSGTVVASATTPSSTPASSPNPVVASATAPSSPNQSAATLVPNAPSSATTLAAATTAVSQEKMTLASAAPVVNNVTNNNVNNSTSGGGSSTSTASVYDDLFTKLVGRALA